MGRLKSKFFRKWGFNETNIDILEKYLLEIAYKCEVSYEKISSHGEKYIIDGTLLTPIGRDVSIRTVWIIEHEGDAPLFITAYPN